MSKSLPLTKEKIPQINFSAYELGNFDLLVDGVFDILINQFGFVVPSLMMYEKETDSLQLKNHMFPSSLEKIVEKILYKKIKDVSIPLTYTDNYHVKTYTEKQIYISDTVGNYSIPFFDKPFSGWIDKLLKVKLIISLPVLVDDVCIGVLGLGVQKKDTITKGEKDLLMQLVTHIGGYLKYTWDICKLKERNERLVKLMKVDNDFLFETKKTLSKLLEFEGINDLEKKEVIERIDYLHSVLLIHEKLKKDM